MKGFYSKIGEVIKYLILGIVRSLISMLLLIVFLYFVVDVAGKKHLYDPKPKRGILAIEFNGSLSDFATPSLLSWQFFKPNLDIPDSLLPLLNGINHAISDKSINAIYIKISDFNLGLAQCEELVNALLAFRSAAKKIIVYSESFDCRSYAFAATVASEIYCPPLGDFFLKGLSIVPVYYNKLLAKLDVTPIILRCGEYKAAVEQFSSTHMSPEAREQNLLILNSIYNKHLHAYAYFSGLDSKKIDSLINNLDVYNVEKASKYHFITSPLHKVDVEEKLLADGTCIGIQSYNKHILKKTEKDKIVVLVVEGEIVSGFSANHKIGSKTFEDKLAELKQNKSVKAVVLRINSPGGSALASDNMWRAIIDLKAQKPVFCSMSDYAASGGYYIATACNTIFAQPHTITGSIGVFGVLFDAHKLLNEKLGVTTDAVTTNRYADLGSNSGRAIEIFEKKILQKQVDYVYKVFIERVVDGRKLAESVVLKFASGRVWSGLKAHEHHLIDNIGGVDDAVHYVAELVGLTQYSVQYQDLNRYYSSLEGFLSKIKILSRYLTSIDKIFSHTMLSAEDVNKLQVGAYMRAEVDFIVQ